VGGHVHREGKAPQSAHLAAVVRRREARGERREADIVVSRFHVVCDTSWVQQVLDALDLDYMTTLAKALQLISSKHDSAAAMTHLDPPTRAIAARVLHALRAQGSTKWLQAGLHTEAAPVTSMFASLFAVS
jgi:hypothetical protein